MSGSHAGSHCSVGCSAGLVLGLVSGSVAGERNSDCSTMSGTVQSWRALLHLHCFLLNDLVTQKYFYIRTDTKCPEPGEMGKADGVTVNTDASLGWVIFFVSLGAPRWKGSPFAIFKLPSIF